MLHTLVRTCLLLACLMAAAVRPAFSADRATVFAAASLSGVLEEILPAPAVAISYGGSGALARQVASGAPADLVILANSQWMDWLIDTGAANRSDVAHIASNVLVVAGPNGTPTFKNAAAFAQSLGQGRIAMGQRDAVPAGQYAVEWLRTKGLWDTVAPRAVETQNVRAALDLMRRGAVPFAIVYASDVARTPGTSVLYAVPAQDHSAIVYPAVALTPAGAELLALLRAPHGQRVLSQNGFGPAP